MRDFLVEMAWVKLAPAALILVHFAVSMLVVVSIVEVCQTAADVVHAMTNVNGILLAGALAAALVPSGCVIFWGCNAIAVQLEHPFRRVQQYLRNHRDKKPFCAREHTIRRLDLTRSGMNVSLYSTGAPGMDFR